MGTTWVIALLLAGWGVTLFLAARSGERLRRQDRIHKSELDGMQSRMERLMTEIDRTVSAQVEQMESRCEIIREMIAVSDDRIRKLREMLNDLEIVSSRLRSPAPPADAARTPEPPSPVGLPVQAVIDLSRRGMSAADIAEHMGMSVPAVRFLLKNAAARAEQEQKTS